MKAFCEFPVNRTTADGRGSLCKACKKIYNATYYLATKDRHNPARAERRKRVRAEAQDRLYAYLREHPCVGCGESDIVVIDFDHLGDKSAEITGMVSVGMAGR